MIQKIQSTLLLLFLCCACFAQTNTWGIDSTRTERRNNAGASGLGVRSGFYEGAEGSGIKTNFPSGVANPDTWWHLLDVRHSSTSANYAMQFSGSFFDDQLYFRKTKGSATQSWNRIVQDINGSLAIGGPVDANTNKGVVNLKILNKDDGSHNLSIDQNLEMLGDKQIIGPGGLAIQKFFVNDTVYGSWIDFPIKYNGPSGIGSGGAGQNPWIAYAAGNGQWFANAQKKDVCYRNIDGKILFGNSSGAATMSITGNKIGIGTNSPTELLSVNGNIVSKKLRITQNDWADYVFEPSYKLPTLQEVEAHIVKYKHLPDVPSAKQIEQEGVDVGSSQAILLKKIEELTLYMIEQNKRLEQQQKQLKNQQSEIVKLNGKLSGKSLKRQ